HRDFIRRPGGSQLPVDQSALHLGKEAETWTQVKIGAEKISLHYVIVFSRSITRRCIDIESFGAKPEFATRVDSAHRVQYILARGKPGNRETRAPAFWAGGASRNELRFLCRSG
ncbi:MAG: hypothetical protein P8Z37_17120, partial [Acidobacteriota bacterium]